MHTRHNRRVHVLLVGLLVLAVGEATGQTYVKRRPVRRHIATNRTFGHLTLSDYDRGERNLFSLMLDGTTLGDGVGGTFGSGRANRLQLIIKSFQSDDRTRGISLWGEFVDNLADYHQPVDLDRVALYVARQSCPAPSDAALFYGRQLAYIRDSMDLLADYVQSLQDRRAVLSRQNRLTPDAAATVDQELIRAKADWDILAIRERSANRDYRGAVGSDARYQRRMGSILGDLYEEAGQRVRYYDDGHRCDSTCRYHVYDGSRFVYLRHHRHGPGCGHALINGRWVVARSASAPAAPHVCDRNCNDHYYDNGRLIVLKNHRHGPGCGHRWDGSHWVLAATRRVVRTVPPGHRCTANCTDHYYDGTRVVVLKNHHHAKGCGHAFNGKYWVDIKSTRGRH